MNINREPDPGRDIPLYRKIRHVLPSRSYLKAYAWMLFARPLPGKITPYA
jgi:hypothetical protein